MSKIRYGLGISLAYPSGEEGVISSFKWLLPAFATRKGSGGRHPVDTIRGPICLSFT
jgi:hypothetical protein